jgi:predicted nucleotidyltransferase
MSMKHTSNISKRMWSAVNSRAIHLQDTYADDFLGYIVYGSLARGNPSQHSDIDAMCIVKNNLQEEFNIFSWDEFVFAEHIRRESYFNKKLDSYTSRFVLAVLVNSRSDNLTAFLERYSEYHKTIERQIRDEMALRSRITSFIQDEHREPNEKRCFHAFSVVKQSMFYLYEKSGKTGTSSRLLYTLKLEQGNDVFTVLCRALGYGTLIPVNEYSLTKNFEDITELLRYLRQSVSYTKVSCYNNILSPLLEKHFIDTSKVILRKGEPECAFYVIQFYLNLILSDKGPFVENHEISDYWNIFKEENIINLDKYFNSYDAAKRLQVLKHELGFDENGEENE